MESKSFGRSVRLLLRDVWIHFFPGIFCLLWRRHRDLGYIGDLSRKGFRGVPLYQCRKCFTIVLTDRDAAKLGGKVP